MRGKDRSARVTTGNILGTRAVAGISVMSSGTAVSSVAADGVRSGSVIQLTPYMYGATLTAVATGTGFIGLAVSSVRTGAFEITAIGSRAPTVDMPVAWSVVHR